METKTVKSTDVKLLKKIADNLLTAQQEIDELLLQLSLGKAEARDKFEEVKHDLRRSIQEFKTLTKEEVKNALPVKAEKKLDQLESTLNSGKVDTKTMFSSQQQKIKQAIEEVERELKDWSKKSPTVNYLDHEIEKFKLKMEILWLKFGLKKFDLKDDVKESLLEARKKAKITAQHIQEQLGEGAEKVEQVKDKLKEAYTHILKIVRKI